MSGLPAGPFAVTLGCTAAALLVMMAVTFAIALKADLIAIHQGMFDGPDSEAMGVLMLIVAMRTGLNATPLMELSRDCLKPHPFMPNMMLLHSVKRRGKGAQAQSVRQTALHDIRTTIRMDGPQLTS